jgi:hypothetical protein
MTPFHLVKGTWDDLEQKELYGNKPNVYSHMTPFQLVKGMWDDLEQRSYMGLNQTCLFPYDSFSLGEGDVG